MITPVSSCNPSFCSRAKFAQKPAQKAVKQILSIEKSSLKGISKTPIRLAEKIDPDTQAAISGIALSVSAIACSASNLS